MLTGGDTMLAKCHVPLINKRVYVHLVPLSWGWTEGGNPGEKGVRSLWKVRKESSGSGIPEVAGTRRNKKKFLNIALYFCIRKNIKRQEPLRKVWEPEVQTSLFPPPPPPPPHS